MSISAFLIWSTERWIVLLSSLSLIHIWIFEAAEELDYVIKNKKRKRTRLKFGVFCSYTLEEELLDPYYLSIRVAIEKKLGQDGYRYSIIKTEDSLETLKSLDGIISLGTFTADEIAWVESLNRPTVFVDVYKRQVITVIAAVV